MPLYDTTRIEWVAQNSREPIVDIGCGDSPYFDENVEFTGVDIDDDSKDMVGEKPENFVEADAADLPFEDNKFNTAILAEILEHVDNPVQVIKEAKRVAYDRVLITVPDENRWLPQAKPGEHEDHQREYIGKDLKRHVIEGGFEEEDITLDHINQFPFCFWVVYCNVDL